MNLRDQIIGVHLGIPSCLPVIGEALSALLGTDNVIATVFMVRLLENALSREDLLGEFSGGTGVISDAVFIAQVGDAERAAEVIKAQLTSCGLLGLAQIGIREGAQWSCVHPSRQIRLDWIFECDQQMAAIDRRIKAINAAVAQLGQMARGNCDNGDRQ